MFDGSFRLVTANMALLSLTCINKRMLTINILARQIFKNAWYKLIQMRINLLAILCIGTFVKCFAQIVVQVFVQIVIRIFLFLSVLSSI